MVYGLHLLALTALGATPISEHLRDWMIAFLEQNATFQKPVLKDDTVRLEIELEAIDRQPGKEWGTLPIKVRLINQRQETVLEGRHGTGFALAPVSQRAVARERAASQATRTPAAISTGTQYSAICAGATAPTSISDTPSSIATPGVIALRSIGSERTAPG
jgi:hypothetical protein